MSIQNKINYWKGEKHKPWTNKLFYDYISFLGHSNKKDITQEFDIKAITIFLKFLEKNNYNEITLEAIYNYIEDMNHWASPYTIYDRSICVKRFLNWLFENKKISFSGNQVFPKLKAPSNSTILSYYSNDEISKILSSIPKKGKTCKRNYAIICLLAYLGMRRSDVRNLKFKSIDWKNNLIIFYQSKTNNLTILPLPNEVRYALLDYIKYERPKINCDYIFVKENGNLYVLDNFSMIVNRVLKKANITIGNRKYGCHVFRHSLATNLLRQHIDMHVIAEILGHNNYDTTKDFYIAYDEKVLRLLALEVPEWK